MPDIESSRQRAEQLRRELNYHSNKYYVEDAPEIDDYEYDMLMRELKAIEETFPELVKEGPGALISAIRAISDIDKDTRDRMLDIAKRSVSSWVQWKKGK